MLQAVEARPEHEEEKDKQEARFLYRPEAGGTTAYDGNLSFILSLKEG
jgi:hypothetical protein